MKKVLFLFVCFSASLLMSCTPKENAEKVFIEENTTFAAAQTDLMLEVTGEPNGKNFPRRINREGKLSTTSKYDWTPGFFPGNLWYLYELTGDAKWKENAEKWTWEMEPVKSYTGNHDIGFMMYCSYGNAERLASKPEYKDILVESAHSLCVRYNEIAKVTKSWNYRKAWDGTEWFYPVIIDNMMNLELLMYAYKVTGDKKFYDVAVNHANTTLENHFREDFSSYHVVNYDTITGVALNKQTCQGYSDNSTWSRGQAWAVYGYTMMYRETQIPAYLEGAKKMVAYFLDNMPDEDLVPYWDYNVGMEGYAAEGDSYAVKDPGKYRDTSASAIVASALFELGELDNNPYYTETAIKMLKSLASEKYRAPLGENANFIIMHCVGSLPHRSEIDSPLVYADYYFLEALVRYNRLLDTGSIY
ncbi:glycoside hydrolase family 88 protein [Parabacteroides sp. OttesenSCG-928-G06]|nr:glycoside hydrolase family 88 protein [Parabacteroides sp. OttesenSCG-928-G06]